MKPIISFALAIAACALSATGWAETCQWKDAAGRTVVSDLPPPGNARDVRCTGSSGAAAPAPAPAVAPKSVVEKDMDFKKRQQEGKEKADKTDKEQQAASDRKENCERARNQMAMLQSGQRIATSDANGERKYMEDNERQAEMERARRIVADSCK